MRWEKGVGTNTNNDDITRSYEVITNGYEVITKGYERELEGVVTIGLD